MSDIKGNNKQIFDFLSSKGASGIGNNADEFQKFMEKDSNRRQVYDYLSSVKATGLGNSYEEFSSFVYDGGQQPVDNSKWAVTPSPYWTGSAKQEQQATAPAEPAPAPTPEPKQAPAPAPKQQAQTQGPEVNPFPYSGGLEEEAEELRAQLTDIQVDEEFVKEYAARKKALEEQTKTLRNLKGDIRNTGIDLEKYKAESAWLKENAGRYGEQAAAKAKADEINGRLAELQKPEMQKKNEEARQARKERMRGQSENNSIRMGSGGFASYPKDMSMVDVGNSFAADQLDSMTDQELDKGSKFDSGYEGDTLDKVGTAIKQYIAGGINNVDLGSLTAGLSEYTAFKTVRDVAEKNNGLINEAFKSLGYDDEAAGKIISDAEAAWEQLQAGYGQLEPMVAELKDMEATLEALANAGDEDRYRAAYDKYKKKYDEYAKLVDEYKPLQDAVDKYKELTEAVQDAVANGLSDSERDVLDSFARYIEAKGLSSATESNAAKAGAGFEQSLEFILDFIVTRGLGKAGTKAASKIAANSVLKKTLGETGAKIVGRGLADMGVSAVRTSLMFPRNLAAYGERITSMDRNGSGVDEFGRYTFDRTKANAALDTALSQYIEYWSEGFGEYFGAAEQALFRKATKLAPKTAIGQTLKNYRGSIGKYLDYGKFDGMFNEMLEEVVGSTFNALNGWVASKIDPDGPGVGDKEALKEFFAGENLATLFFSFLPMSAIGAATNMKAYHQMKERYDKSVGILNPFIEDGSIKREDLDDLTSRTGELSPEQILDKFKEISIKAAKAQRDKGKALPKNFDQALAGYLEGSFSMNLQREAWEDSKKIFAVASAYTAQYENPDARLAWDLAQEEQAAKAAALAAGFTEEDLDKDSAILAHESTELEETEPERSNILFNYSVAKAQQNALSDGYNAETQGVNERNAQFVRTEIDTNGQVVQATLNGTTPVYITQKDATVNPDGTVSTPTGDGVVTYVDQAGNKGSAKASAFSGVISTATGEYIDSKSAEYAARRQAAFEAAQNTVSPTGQAREISEKVGQSIVVSDGNGVYQPFKVERMTNGGNSVVLSGDKKALQGIAEAMGMRVPTSGYLEAPVTRLYPLLEKEENGSLSTGPGEETQEEAPAAPAQEAAPAAEQAANLGDLRDQTVPISVNGQVQNAHVIDMSDGNVMYEELDENGDVVRTSRLSETDFARAMQEAANPTPAAEAPVSETPAAAVEETPAPAIPVDEKTGEKMYAAPGVRVEDAIADLYATEGLTEADVDQYIAEEAAKAEAARNPERGNMSPQAWGQAKQEAARVADFWAAMQRAANQRKAQQEEAIEEAVEEATPVETPVAEAPAAEQKQAKPRTAPRLEDLIPESKDKIVSRLKNWSKRTGVKVRIVNSIDEVSDTKAKKALKGGRRLTGWYLPETNEVEVYLPNITNTIEADKTFIHETVAHKGLLGLLGRKGYDELCDRVWNEMMTPEEQQEFLEYNRHLSGSEEFLRRAAADEYIARLSESLDMPDKRNIFERIIDWIMDKLGWGRDVSGIENAAAKRVAGLETITRSDLYDLLEDSLKRFEKGRKKVSDVLQGENGDVRFSEATYMPFKDEFGNEHEGTRQQLINYMVGQGFPQKQIDDFVQHMDYWYDFTQNIANLVNPDGSFRYQAFHEWSETIPEYKMYEGKIVKAISTLVTNGEYPLNFELSTDCIKREAFTQIINEMLKMDASFWQKLTPANIIEVQNLEKAFGIEVACPLCFVEAKRLNILSWATSVADKWNTALNAIAPGVEHTPFEFYKDGDLTVDQVGRKNGEVLITQRMKQEIDAINSFLGDAKNLRDKDAKRLRENAKEMEKLLNGWIEAYGAEHGGDITGFTLTKKQEAQLEKIRNRNLKSTTGRMMRIIAAHPEVRHSLSPMDLLGSMGLMRIQRMQGEGFAEMLSAIVSANGTGTPKIVQSAVPYDGEIIDVPQARFEKAAGIGGARLFSFSDADLTKIFDIMQIMWDCAARQAKVQSYSKEVPYIVLFGTSGVKINMSMLPEARPGEDIERQYRAATKAGKQRIKHDVEENVGLQLDQEGNIVGLDLSDSHSISDEFARWIFHNPEYNANCGAVMVGIGVNHSIYCMMQPHIRMLIPFHLSGMPLAAREKGDVFWYHDFTNEQNTGVMVNGLRVKLMGKDGSIVPSVKEDFNIYEGEEKADWDIRERCRAYVKWCDENGLLPKFPWAVNAEGYANWMREHGYEPRQDFIDAMNAHTTDGVWDEYYKVITDFTAYQPEFDAEGNMIGEKSARHLPVTGRFNTDPKLLQAVFGTNTEGTEVTSEDSMLNNRERSIENTDKHAREIAALAINMLNNGKKASDMVDMSGSQFNNKADSELFLQERELPAPEDVKALEKEQPEAPADVDVSEGGVTMFRERTAPAPEKTQKVYKLMRLGEDGNLYPLFIDRDAQPIKLGTWYDADSPNMEFLKKMPSGVFLVDAQNGTYTSLEDYKKERGEKVTKLPGLADVEEASRNGLRWMKITETENPQRRYEGENRKYENIGINGSEGVSTFAMRPGWHAGSLPTMRQIGKGSEKNLRDDNFVWVEGEIAADKDYNEEAQRNPDKDIPTHIPTDGFYMKATNANKKASQADRVGWYVAGAFKPNRIMSDSEATAVIDQWNAEHPDAPVEYDWPRESGKVFNAETMQLEDPDKGPDGGGGGTRFREANRNQLGFVSNADAALDRIKMDKATPEQWVKMLEKEGGLKAGEDKWLGLSDWLKSQDRKSITKDEIADYIDEHRIQIEEVNYRDMDDFDPVTEAGSGLDSEFDDLGATDAAFEQMQEKYPGLKDIMQIWRGGRAGNHLVLRDEVDEDTIERYMGRWGILENPIQSMRLEYTTEGLDNKREIALTVPTIESWNQSDKIHFGDAGNGRAVAWIRFGDTLAANEGVEAAKERHREAARALGEYRDELQEKYADSDQPYYEACTPEELSKLKSLKEEEHRLYEEWDNLNATPRRVLVIDEIQSKRHQEGREHGYAAANVEALEQKWRDASKAYDDFIDSLKEKYGGYEGMRGHITEDENQRAIELNDASIDAANAVDRAKGGIPAAPFEKNWHELAMKRMLRLAAEEGYDYVAWTSGGQQAERYNIGGKVDWIQRGNDFGQFPESVFIKMGDKVNSVEVDENGTIVDSTHALSDTVGKPLSDLLGKELANKIMSAETGPNGRLEGEGLRVGGEGMKGFYDDILPRFMNKYGKKWGVKVSDITLPNVEKSGEIMHSVPVTQEMKESVMQGQTMFREASVVEIKSKDSTESRDDVINKIPAGGALYPNDDQQRDIRVTRTALRHSLPHPDEARIKAAANIDRVIKNAVKLGDLPVDPDEIGKTDNVSVFYCPVRIDDKLYSARLVVKKYIDQKGDVLDEMAMYDMNLHKRKADSSVSSVAGKPGTYIDESASAYKVKDLIFNTQEADKKIAGVTDTFFRERITPEQDKEYMDAVNAGDMEKAQRMVDEAARAAGYTIRAFHGTPTENGEMPFTVFESGHFTDDHEFAEYFGNAGGYGYVYDTYLKMENPLVYDFKGQNSDDAIDENGNIISTWTIIDRARESGNYDGVIIENVDEYGNGIEKDESSVYGEYPGAITDYIPLSPSQVKSAEPVTYDDNGNVIPLSERFNPENNDIRFREARPVDARSAQVGYEEEIQKKTTQFLLEWQDQDIPVRAAINQVMNEVGMTDLPEDCDYLTRHNLVSSRADAQMHNYKLFYFEPMMQTIGQIEDILAGGKPGFFENLFGSRKQKRLDAYKKIVDYCYAVSALERNAWKRAEAQRLMEKALERLSEKWEQERAAINADSRLTAEEKAKAIERAEKRYQKESREIEDKYADRDYSGITALMGRQKEEWQEAEDEARAMIADFQRSVNNNDLINEMWDRIRACTDFNLEHAYKFGLLSRAEYERLHGTESQPRMWEYYLPLRGFKERTAEDEYNYTMFTSDMAGGAVVTEAKGRVTEADDPFATMRHISELEIVQGLQNWAKQSLYNFVLRAGDNSLLTQVEPWYVKEPGSDNWTVAEPNEGESLEEFEARMQEAYENGEARRGRNGLKLGHIMGNKMHRNQHMIRLKLNGAEKMIWVNGNPVLAQSVNGVPGWNNWYTKNVNKVNRALSQFYTTYSLKFITKNKLRDTQFSRIAALVDEPQAYLTQLEKNWWANNGYVAFGYPMMKLVAEWESGELEKKEHRTEREQMFIDFMYDGGATGYSMINSMDKIKRELEKMVKNAGHGESPLNPIRWYAMGVGALNEASELLTRFTFYQTSRMMGRSRERSAYDAKESSVNFNRRGLRSGKGAAGWTAAAASTLYLFINPAIQGLDKFVRLHKSHPWKMGLVDATYFMMGFVNSLLNAMVAGASDGGDGDDEEKMGPDWYWNIPEWVRRSNMIIGSPFKKLGKWGYLVIALPIEYKGFYAMGELVSSIVQRKYAAKDAPTLANEVVGVVSELLPINPVEGYTPGDNAAMSVLRNMAPDIIAPIVDVATNRSFAGIPLWKENIYDEAQPLSQSAFASTPEILNKAVIKLSEVTSTMPWHIDIPSGAVRGLLKGYGGGGYTFVEDVSKLIFADAAHPRHWDNVPFVGGFTGYLEEDRRNSYNNNMLQRYKELSDDVVKRVRSAAPGEDLKAADIYNKPESLPQNARVTILLNSDEYILGKMYYNGMLKAGDDVKRLRTAWNKAKKAYLDIADDKDVSDEAKDAAEKEVQKAWLDFTTAEDGLVNSLLEEEYNHARKKIANGVPYEKKETLSEKAYKLTNRK